MTTTAPDEAAPVPPMAFRRAEGAQAAEARELVLSVYAAAGTPADAVEASRLPDGLRAAGGELWVLLLRGLTAGTIGLRPGQGGMAEVCWWSVAPGNRHFGLGEWMLAQAVAWARTAGKAGITAVVDAANRPAVAALQAERFRPPEGVDLKTASGPVVFSRQFG